jgi:hypothetical protein
MSSFYNGNGTNPQATNGYAPIAVQSTSATNPVTVTTTTVHGFNTGDTVGHDGLAVSALDGDWQITVTGAQTYVLNGSSSLVAGGQQGYAIDYAVNPIPLIPGDTDLANAASVNVPLEHSLDVVPYLYQRAGRYRIFTQEFVKVASAGTPTYTSETTAWTTTSTITANTWTLIGSAGTNLFTFGSWPNGGPVVQGNDILLCDFSGSIVLGGTFVGSDYFFVGLFLTIDGTPQTTPIAGTVQRGLLPFTYASIPELMWSGMMRGIYFQTAGAAHTYNFSIGALWQSAGGSGPSFAGFGSYSISLTHLRPNT